MIVALLSYSLCTAHNVTFAAKRFGPAGIVARDIHVDVL